MKPWRTQELEGDKQENEDFAKGLFHTGQHLPDITQLCALVRSCFHSTSMYIHALKTHRTTCRALQRGFPLSHCHGLSQTERVQHKLAQIHLGLTPGDSLIPKLWAGGTRD